MILYTGQMNVGKKLKKEGRPFLDVTVKSGDRCFSPDWKLLSDSKAHRCSEEEYIDRYTELMRESFRKNKGHWKMILEKEELTILCYCGKGKFCHRLILVDIFEKVCKLWGIEFTYGGELC